MLTLLPFDAQVNKHGDSPLTGWFDKSTKPFASDNDRDQFLCEWKWKNELDTS